MAQRFRNAERNHLQTGRIAFIVIDYLTGVMVAILEKMLSSEIGFRRIFKKVLIFMIVSVAHIIDSRIIGNGGAIRTAVIFFYLSNEGISILENAGKIGLLIPQKLREVLEQLKESDKNEQD
jgi:toxin secretion/phage lysis holin